MEQTQTTQNSIPLHVLNDQLKSSAHYALSQNTPYAEIYLENSKKKSHSLSEAFDYSICAHWMSVASFVPTDVDVHIRFKLWRTALSGDPLELHRMFERTLEARAWDPRPVSQRALYTNNKCVISGHQGEWLSIATAAYSSAKQAGLDIATDIALAITQEVHTHQTAWKEILAEQDFLKLLNLSAIIAHNIGDFDRVCKLWCLEKTDPMRELCDRSFQAFELASEVYKVFGAKEHHRHFALRKPAGLKKSVDFLLPFAPFLDQWGSVLAKSPQLNEREFAEIVGTLLEAFEKLNQEPGETGPILGYARALSGILNSYPGGERALTATLNAKDRRLLLSGAHRVHSNQSQTSFEAQLSARVRTFLKSNRQRFILKELS